MENFNFDFDKDQIKEAVFKFKDEAIEFLKDDVKVEAFLQSVEEKLAKVPKVGSMLADVPVLVSMARSYVMKQYRELPASSAVAIIAVLIYFLSPFDLISDLIPVVGFVDDAAALAFVVSMVHDDLAAYVQWQKDKGVRE